MKKNYLLKRTLKHSIGAYLLLGCCLLAVSTLYAQNFSLPADANLLDVTKPPFNADNTGLTDATSAIQAVLDSAGSGDNSGVTAGSINLVYLPKGTYLISDELSWTGNATRDIMHGENRDSVIIKLTDNNPLYASKSISKGLIYTGDFTTPVAGANRFRNGIYNLTLNTGSGNPGATGVRYFANNQGSINNVLIKSGDGEGNIGLDLGFSNDNGTLLAKDVTILGFDTGIRTAGVVNSATLQNIKLHNQKVQAFFNDNQLVSVDNLEVVGEVPGVITQGVAMFTIINSSFTGTGAASGLAAIHNSNGLFARNITTTGYLLAIDNSTAGTGILTIDQDITEFSSHPVLSLYTNPERSLNLPIKQTPEVPYDDLANWVNIFDFAGSDPDVVTDWAPVLQAAIDSSPPNVTTIYFPNQQVYNFGGDVMIRGNIERIIGLESKIGRVNVNAFRFIVDEGTKSQVVIERFNSIGSRIRIVQRSSRTVILKSFEINRTTLEPNSRKVYLEDVVADRLILEPGNKAWLRQYNPEFEEDIPRIQNKGSDLWILGIKTEQDADIATTTQNG
ncbi:MAG: glycoside hydrolase family 55 protein [Cytophagales bacterium]|nr:glycoside hydrolase family 55 protein [Cytophagales bacterium]